jgi:hypothetical protein
MLVHSRRSAEVILARFDLTPGYPGVENPAQTQLPF